MVSSNKVAYYLCQQIFKPRLDNTCGYIKATSNSVFSIYEKIGICETH